MKYTLANCMSRINQALNYPALTYDDVSAFFDMAIADLNTSLHISIAPISVSRNFFEQQMSKVVSNRVVLPSDPDTITIPATTENDALTHAYPYFFNTDTSMYGKYNATLLTYTYYDRISGVYVLDGVPKYYEAVELAEDAPIWIAVMDDPDEMDLLEYLTMDWINLWLIPYVCLKYTVRDGGTAQFFAEEVSQGYSQLQNAYNVPEKVYLATQAGRTAYLEDVETYLPDLNRFVPTKAIYNEMKHERSVNPTYDSFYDRGGFGND